MKKPMKNMKITIKKTRRNMKITRKRRDPEMSNIVQSYHKRKVLGIQNTNKRRKRDFTVKY